MLSVNNVTKKYGKVIANENISLQIADGQIAVLLGPNGAGKSTIIKSIIGFLKYQGSVTVDGLLNKSIEAKRIMGYIPEIPSLYPNLTVDEHLEFIRIIRKNCCDDLNWMIRKRNSATSYPKECSRS